MTLYPFLFFTCLTPFAPLTLHPFSLTSIPVATPHFSGRYTAAKGKLTHPGPKVSNVAQSSTRIRDFLCFSLKQKFVTMNRFIVPNLVYSCTCVVSGKSVANSRKYESPNFPILTKKCVPGGKRLPLAVHFFVIIGKFGLSCVRDGNVKLLGPRYVIPNRLL